MVRTTSSTPSYDENYVVQRGKKKKTVDVTRTDVISTTFMLMAMLQEHLSCPRRQDLSS